MEWTLKTILLFVIGGVSGFIVNVYFAEFIYLLKTINVAYALWIPLIVITVVIAYTLYVSTNTKLVSDSRHFFIGFAIASVGIALGELLNYIIKPVLTGGVIINILASLFLAEFASIIERMLSYSSDIYSQLESSEEDETYTLTKVLPEEVEKYEEKSGNRAKNQNEQ